MNYYNHKRQLFEQKCLKATRIFLSIAQAIFLVLTLWLIAILTEKV